MGQIIQVQGIEEIVREFEKRRIDVSVGLEAICHAGAEVIQSGVEERAPGSIAEGIVRETKQRSGTKVVVHVQPDKEHFYAKFLEYGTPPHKIRPRGRRKRGAQALAFGGRYAAWANHPGIKARPFMRPAFDHEKGAATEKMSKETARKLKV